LHKNPKALAVAKFRPNQCEGSSMISKKNRNTSRGVVADSLEVYVLQS
jgi:hypothetical protein